MIFRFLLAIILAIGLTNLKGQVCCSLVGAIDQGGGLSSSHWGTHWPSEFDDFSKTRWIVGIQSLARKDNHLDIRYGPAFSTYFQASKYITKTIIGYGQVDFNSAILQEKLSFDPQKTRVDVTGYRFGTRFLLPNRLGFGAVELNNTNQPKLSNDNFTFQLASVPAVSISWINRFSMPWQAINPFFLSAISITAIITENLKEDPNVFIDKRGSISFSSLIQTNDRFNFAPFIQIESQKLLAPLSPWETNRQTRWLNEVKAGLDVTPTHHQWNWLHGRLAIPIFWWASRAEFPDGTEPVIQFSLVGTCSGNR